MYWTVSVRERFLTFWLLVSAFQVMLCGLRPSLFTRLPQYESSWFSKFILEDAPLSLLTLLNQLDAGPHPPSCSIPLILEEILFVLNSISF